MSGGVGGRGGSNVAGGSRGGGAGGGAGGSGAIATAGAGGGSAGARAPPNGIDNRMVVGAACGISQLGCGWTSSSSLGR